MVHLYEKLEFPFLAFTTIIASEFICHFYGAIILIGSVMENQYWTDVLLLTIGV